MIIFPDLPGIQVEEVAVAEEITLTLRTTSPTASCPSCGTVSSRIQSRSTRKLRDLPTVGRPILLMLHVRRFFCKRSTCAQKMFVERLPDLCRPHAEPHQTVARSAAPAWPQRRRPSWRRSGKRARLQRESRYDLASSSSVGTACQVRATRHRSRRLGLEASVTLWNPGL